MGKKPKPSEARDGLPKADFDYFGYRFDPKRRDAVYLTVERRAYIPKVGDMLLSSDLRSADEIDDQVRELCEQIKAIGRQAKVAHKRRTRGEPANSASGR